MASRFAVAKQKLLQDLESVIVDVYGSFANRKRKSRRRWMLINPYSASKSAKMSVFLSGLKAGAFIDFTTDVKGDVIDLVAFGQEGAITDDSRMRAVEWAEDRYGIRNMDPAQKKRIEAEGAERRAQLVEIEAKTFAEQRDRIRKMFFASKAAILGTPIETYMAGRGIALSSVPHLTPAFRYRADCEYWPLAPRDGEGERIGKGPIFPAMVSAMVSGNGSLSALHLTFLAPDGRAKAPVQEIAVSRGLDPKDFSAKLFKGDVQGFVIRCTNGPSGLSAERAAEAGIAGLCGVTEGIEDSVTVGVAEPSLRMWAAGSLSGLLHLPDHPTVSGWIIFKDNDWGKPQAQALFKSAIARIRAFGKPVEVVAMPRDWGKDVNEALNQEE